jgi:hypothetical protein
MCRGELPFFDLFLIEASVRFARREALFKMSFESARGAIELSVGSGSFFGT